MFHVNIVHQKALCVFMSVVRKHYQCILCITHYRCGFPKKMLPGIDIHPEQRLCSSFCNDMAVLYSRVSLMSVALDLASQLYCYNYSLYKTIFTFALNATVPMHTDWSTSPQLAIIFLTVWKLICRSGKWSFITVFYLIPHSTVYPCVYLSLVLHLVIF